jgi:hypothetical protein
MVATSSSPRSTRDVLWLALGLLLACGGCALGALFIAGAALRPAPARQRSFAGAVRRLRRRRRAVTCR